MSTVTSKLPAHLPRGRFARLGLLNVVLAAALAGAGVAAYLVVGTSQTSTPVTRTATATRGVVLSTISATGELQPATQLAVDFTSSGLLASVGVKPGQHVKKGQVLGRIDSTSASQSVDQAQAALATAQANYQQTLTGETAAQRRADALSITQARAALANAEKSAAVDRKSSAASTAQAKSQLGIDQGQLKVDLYQREQDRTPYASVDAAQAAVDAAQARLTAAQAKQRDDQVTQLWAQNQQSNDKQALSTAQANNNKSDIAKYTTAVNGDQQTLNALQITLSSDGFAVTDAQKAVTDAQGYLTALQNDEKTIRADEQRIYSDRQAIANAQRSAEATAARDAQSIASAELSLKTTRASVATKQAPATASAIASAKASVVQAQISLENARTALDQTTLRSPIAGVVSSVNGAVGTQTAGGGTAVLTASSSSSSGAGSGGGSSSSFVTLTQTAGMQVLASFSETDTSKLRPGQAATVTVDALPNKQLAAHVLAIASTATTSSNVVTYDVTFALDRTSPQLKPGMTANVDVIIGEADNVVHVPTAAVRGSGRNATVAVVRNGVQQNVPVVVGLQGDSSTAILSGLKAGDTVALPSVSISSSSGSTGTSNTGGRGGRGGVFFGGGFGG